MSIYFSDCFNVDYKVIEEYGAFNISIITDLPLFIDPFLLFNSKKQEYRELHKDIINYLKFLRNKALEGKINKGLLKAWFMFPEVKQNWFGFTQSGNAGSGLGIKFAQALNENLNTIFENFGEENITGDSHIEKLCLINDGVGKDNISDFTTNLIKDYLLKYTQKFALRYIDKCQLKKFRVEKVRFNYETESWESDEYTLPVANGEYVLLTPKDILTKDQTFMNSKDMYNGIELIINTIENEALRSQINNYLMLELKKDMKKDERKKVYKRLVESYPQLVDYYIKEKEKNKEKASYSSKDKVRISEEVFVENVLELIDRLSKETKYYDIIPDSYEEAYERALYLKDVIENKDGYKIFYIDNKPIKREADIQIMYKLVCANTISDFNAEVNNGRGPVDFKASNGSKDKTLVEFKLASNSKIKKNLKNQVEVYKKANNTKKSIKVILYYTEKELEKVTRILKELELVDDRSIILIDARNDNKPSASNA